MTPAEKLAQAQAKKKGGWGWFGDLVGDVVDMASNPIDTGKALAGEAKRTFIDPLTGLADSVNPFMDQRPIDRVNKAAGGLLAAADFLTPAIPEGVYATRASRQLAARMADAPNSGRKYRGVLGVHGSPMPGLSQIEPRSGSYLLPDEKVAWAWRATPTGEKGMPPYDPDALFYNAMQFAGRTDAPGDVPTVYVARFPRRGDWIAQQADPAAEMRRNMGLGAPYIASTEPGAVVGAIDNAGSLSPGDSNKNLRELMQGVMRPSERLAYQKARVGKQLKRTENRWRKMPSRYEDQPQRSVYELTQKSPAQISNMTPEERRAYWDALDEEE